MWNEQVREAARERVLARTAKRWNRIHPTGFFGKLFRPFFGSAEVDAIFVVEYDAVDDSQLTCDGNPIRAWCIDETGERSVAVEEVDTGPVHGRIWHRQLVGYAIHADNTKVLVNEWDGPGYGRLVHYAVKPDGNGVRLRFRGASPIIGGHTLG